MLQTFQLPVSTSRYSWLTVDYSSQALYIGDADGVGIQVYQLNDFGTIDKHVAYGKFSQPFTLGTQITGSTLLQPDSVLLVGENGLVWQADINEDSWEASATTLLQVENSGMLNSVANMWDNGNGFLHFLNSTHIINYGACQ